MRRIPFIKMQSIGNIIIIIPQNVCLEKKQIQILCHYQRGLGCDHLMILSEPLQIWNRDGSVAMACGNGTRCVVAYLTDSVNQVITLQGPSGLLSGWKLSDGQVTVMQGKSRIGIMSACALTSFISLEAYNLPKAIPVDMGNPHLVILFSENSLPDPSYISVVAPQLSVHPLFEQGVNVSFVHLKNNIDVITWERGVGFTQGCGSAACAIAAALDSIGHSDWPITLHMKGGNISVMPTDRGWEHTAPVAWIADGFWYISN